MTDSYEIHLDEPQNLKKGKLYQPVTITSTTALQSQEVDPGISDEDIVNHLQAWSLIKPPKASDKFVIIRSVSSTERPPNKLLEMFAPEFKTGFPSFYDSIYTFVLSEGYPEFNKQSVSDTATLSELVESPEYVSLDLKGVFSPQYGRKVLYSQLLEVKTAELPHFKPYISIDRRTLSREEDVE